MNYSLPKRLLRLTEVSHRTTLSRSSIYAGVKNGTFPKPIKVSANRVAWADSDIEAKIAELVAAA